MKKIYCFCLLLLIHNTLKSQVERNSASGIGMALGNGAKAPSGVFGGYYVYNLNSFKKRIELNAGIGLNYGAVYKAGLSYRLFNISKRSELYLGFSYSYLTAGSARYANESNDDIDVGYYNVSSLNFLHYFLSGRYYLNESSSFQLSLGYGQNLTGYPIKYDGGVDLYYDKVKSSIESGLLISVEFIVFPFGKLKADS